MAPSAGIEPAAYRLGGGRSIRLSYEGQNTKTAKVAIRDYRLQVGVVKRIKAISDGAKFVCDKEHI